MSGVFQRRLGAPLKAYVGEYDLTYERLAWQLDHENPRSVQEKGGYDVPVEGVSTQK